MQHNFVQCTIFIITDLTYRPKVNQNISPKLTKYEQKSLDSRAKAGPNAWWKAMKNLGNGPLPPDLFYKRLRQQGMNNEQSYKNIRHRSHEPQSFKGIVQWESGLALGARGWSPLMGEWSRLSLFWNQVYVRLAFTLIQKNFTCVHWDQSIRQKQKL